MVLGGLYVFGILGHAGISSQKSLYVEAPFGPLTRPGGDALPPWGRRPLAGTASRGGPLHALVDIWEFCGRAGDLLTAPFGRDPVVGKFVAG